jgi:hypothetical protein
MSELVVKRKFRWTLEGDLPGGNLKPQFVRVAAKPSISFEEIEIAPGTKIPGKYKWETIKVTILETPGEFWAAVYPSVYQNDAEMPKFGTFKLTLYDGNGVRLEEFDIENAYIKNVEFEEWDHSYSNEDAVSMEIHCEKVKYKSLVDFK